MFAMLIWLTCDQCSNACRTSFSASDTFSGSVFVRMLSQRLRIISSRSRSKDPCAMSLRNCAIRLLRAFQLFASGDTTSLSPSNNASVTPARMTRSCWRFLIFIRPFPPMKVERELHRSFAAHLVHFQVSNLPGRTEPVEHLEERLVIARH